jgi:hypothetical protein
LYLLVDEEEDSFGFGEPNNAEVDNEEPGYQGTQNPNY